MSSRPLTALFVLAAVFFTGCTGTWSERLAETPPQVRAYHGTIEQVHAAAQKAFKRVDFNVTRASIGRIEAASAIHSSETFADSRQVTARVQMRELEPGTVAVEMWVTQEVASQSFGGTHRTARRDHSFYGLYFAMLQQVLQEHGVPQPEPKG